MKEVSVFLFLLVAVAATGWAQNVQVSCTEYYDSSPPVVTVNASLGGSGSVTGNCTLARAAALMVVVNATSGSICEITVNTPSTIGPHQFSWEIRYYEGSFGPVRQVGSGRLCIWKPTTYRILYIYVGGTITLARQEGAASSNITVEVRTVSGSCSFDYTL